MSDTSAFIAGALQKLPDLKYLEAYMEQDIEALVDQVLPPEKFSISGLEALGSQSIPPHRQQSSKREKERRRLSHYLSVGKRAVEKIRKNDVDADLDIEEIEGLESIILAFGRPALHIHAGSFFRPPQNWEILEQFRFAIEQTCRSVGRIEIYKDDESGYAGTGFLVAENVIMTNKHVAKCFCQETPIRWVFQSSVVASIDYLKELNNYDTFEFELVDVIGMHEYLDLALFKAAPLSYQGYPAPIPLKFASTVPLVVPQCQVYTVGHPMWDGNEDDPDTIYRIFAEPHGVKRLQPGLILGVFPDYNMFTHDCSTLTGNSGSCVVDVQTNRVIGLHFKGRPRQVNWAVALWMLWSDPLIKRAGICFE